MCDDAYKNTAPVGSYTANGFGLYDVLGNVFEWTQDCWHEDYSGAPSDGSAWESGDCSGPVLRGGSWVDGGPRFLCSAFRGWGPAVTRAYTLGFRFRWGARGHRPPCEFP